MKRLSALVIMLICLATLVSCQSNLPAGGAANPDLPKTDAGYGDEELIGEDAARQIALDHAGFSENEVRFTDAETDFENGRKVYQIEFIYDKTEYEVEIDANTGEILEYNSESVYD